MTGDDRTLLLLTQIRADKAGDSGAAAKSSSRRALSPVRLRQFQLESN